MINFKPITLSDKKILDLIFKGNDYRVSDLSFANLFAWSSRYNTEIAVEDETVFVRSKASDKECSYMMPIGKMPVDKSMELIRNDSAERSATFRIIGATLKMWESIEKSLPGQFEFIPDRGDFEYIYLTEKLITLSGKKLQTKRNHINRFKAENPDWEYRRVTDPAEISECINMLDDWERSVFHRMQRSQRDEYFATRKLLENFEYLGLHVATIRIKDKIIAFATGEPLTDDTFVVHSEKAFGEINGSYAIINQQFAENEAYPYKYINREEDLGIENLRKAKLSYYPEILLEQGIVLPIN